MHPDPEATTEGGWRPIKPALSVFESIACLYAPGSSALATVVLEAGEAWSVHVPPVGSADVVLWGNPPASGGSAAWLVGWATHRERALRGLRRTYGPRVRAIHRLPPAVRGHPMLQPTRHLMMAGIVVELHRGAVHTRVIDEVLTEAGAPTARIALRPSRDGSALMRIRARTGVPLELRVAALAGRKDPARNAEALTFLETRGAQRVPRLHARGTTRVASWTTETVLAGARPPRLSRTLHADIALFCTRLPASDGPPTSLRERMLVLGERYPRWSTLTRQLSDLPVPNRAMVQHGDLWIGNALVSRSRLSGVIDWDTWHPNGLPGVDLLQLHAMDRRRRTGEEIGSLWRSGLWRSEEFRSATRTYWETIGVVPTDADLEAVGLDWWIGQLFKRQSFAARPHWIEDNVDRVLMELSGSA